MKRIIPALIILPLLYLFIMKLSTGYVSVLAGIAALLALYEFYAMYRVRATYIVLGLVSGAGVIAGYFAGANLGAVIAVSVIVISTWRLFAASGPEESIKDIAPVMLGIVYIPLLFGMLIYLHSASPQWIIFLFASIWGADSFAYYVGKGIGRRKLYVSISPNKTWAGAIASLLGGVAGALAVRSILLQSVSFEATAIAGLMIGFVTIIGDLVESMFKRDAGVKDSSALVPGHGGLLDKIDGALFAGPSLYWLLCGMGVIGG